MDNLALARANHHPRDERIRFDVVEHKYYIDGCKYPSSVSGLIHDAFPAFDGPSIVDRGFEKWKRDKESRYCQLIKYLQNIVGFDDNQAKAEILLNWSTDGNLASTAGTKTHEQIEFTLNSIAVDQLSKEFQQYLRWRATHPGWEPYRTEWSVFSEPELICGQIDSLWKDEDGKFVMVDWKRVAAMKKQGFRDQMGFPPFENLPASNFNHYIVQQNVYTWMLEQNYGIRVDRCYLVQVHPDIPDFEEHLLPRIQKAVRVAMATRREKVQRGELVAITQSEVLASKKRKVDTGLGSEEKERRDKLIKFHQSRSNALKQLF